METNINQRKMIMNEDYAFDQRERLVSLKEEIQEKVEEFKDILCDLNERGASFFMVNLEAYVFNQLEEHIENGNPYNQSLNSIIESFEDNVPLDEDEEED
jgi:hypothetical protein